MKCENEKIPLTACFSIVKQQHYIFLNKILEDEVITAGSAAILIYLLYNDTACQDDIANWYNVDKGSIARGIMKLKELDLISKHLDENNRRKCVLSLTIEGKRIAKKIIDANEKWENELSSELNISNDILHDVLTQIAKKTKEINKNLKETGGEK